MLNRRLLRRRLYQRRVLTKSWCTSPKTLHEPHVQQIPNVPLRSSSTESLTGSSLVLGANGKASCSLSKPSSAEKDEDEDSSVSSSETAMTLERRCQSFNFGPEQGCRQLLFGPLVRKFLLDKLILLNVRRVLEKHTEDIVQLESKSSPYSGR